MSHVLGEISISQSLKTVTAQRTTMANLFESPKASTPLLPKEAICFSPFEKARLPASE